MNERFAPRGGVIATGFAAFSVLAAMAQEKAGEQSVVFKGMCDASAAAAVDANRFIVADDEDNILRLYSRSGGEALGEFDMSEFIGNQGKKKAKEADLEAAAQLGDQVFWIASHGRNSKGKDVPERQRLFATTMTMQDGKVKITPSGKPYNALLDDLVKDPALAKFGLEAAAKLAPKAPGGLNIEGLAATAKGHLLIGFRSPAPEGKALVVPLVNPREVINGKPAKLGEPVLLDLQGLGIRSIERVGQKYVIIAGATGAEEQVPKLFEWDGKALPKPVPGVTLAGLNPEGVAFHSNDEKGEYFILSDDGTRSVDGTDCKSLKDPSMKQFRGRTIPIE
jgi:hypothetical protein